MTVTKSDAEIGTAQGDASLAGAVYGIYKGETLVDTYTTDKNGQFVTKEYICDNDWTVREITPSEGYPVSYTHLDVYKRQPDRSACYGLRGQFRGYPHGDQRPGIKAG